MIPMLPFVAFGTAIVVDTGLTYLWQYTCETLQAMPLPLSLILSAGVCVVIVGAPFLVSLGLDLDHVRNGFPTEIDPFLVNPAEARQVAQFINTHAQPADLVIVTPAISWLLDTRTVDVQMSIAATGRGTVHYPPNIPADRWLFDPRIEQARYVVLDNFWRSWGVANIPGLSGLLQQVQEWPQVFQIGSLMVYQNPVLPP